MKALNEPPKAATRKMAAYQLFTVQNKPAVDAEMKNRGLQGIGQRVSLCQELFSALPEDEQWRYESETVHIKSDACNAKEKAAEPLPELSTDKYAV